MKQIMDLEQLPNDFGKRNKAFVPYKDRIHNSFKSIHYYASVISIALWVISYFFPLVV